MSFALRVAVAVLMTIAAAPMVKGQDRASVGVTATSEGAIGVLWQPVPSVAIRPSVTFDVVSGRNESPFPGGSDESTSFRHIWLDVAVLLYFKSDGNLRFYAAPSIGRHWFTARTYALDDTADLRVAGALGGEYALHQRFALFAEAGVRLTRSTREITEGFAPNVVSYTNRTSAVSSLGRVGGIFRF